MSDEEKRVSLRDLIQKPLRLRKSIIKRVDELRDERGQTFQTFVQNAVIKAIAEADAEADRNIFRRDLKKNEKGARHAVHGLGIRERLEQEQYEPVTEEHEERVAAAPVIVNVGSSVGATASGSGDLATLARMVVEGLPHDRRRLLQSACNALAKGRSVEEALQLAEQLDVEIKRLDVPTTALERVRARKKK